MPDSAVAVGTETETQTATTNMEYIDDMDGATIEELLASNKRVRSKEGDDLNKIVTANDDGSYTMRLFNHPVKFINEAGKIEDISLELKTSNNGGFETKAGVSRTQFSNKISNGISLSGNGVEIELLPSMNTVSSSTKATATLAMEQATKALSVTKIDKGAVSYYYDDKTTLEYSLTYTGFKEDIVVKEYTGQTEYNFTLNTNGLTLKCENGSYYLADENGEKKATIGTIVIFTADERNNTLGSMTHEVIKENELYMLTIHVDAEWLKDEKTVYPIRIDPTMEINYAYDGVDAIDDITINSNAGSDYDNDHIYIGKRNNYGISRVLMRFNYNFKNLFSDQRVIQRAHVEIRDIMCESTSMTVYARMFKGADWGEDNNTSWESVSQGEDTHSMPGVTVNYSLGNAKDPKHRYKINIMDAMKYWVSGEYDYRQGIVLRAPDSVENGTTELYKTFGSYQHTSYKPSLVITYLDHEQNCEPYGYLDAVESTNIRGWAWCIDAPNTPVRVKLYLENQTTGVTYSPITVQATTYRPDVESAGYGTGKYGFRYNIDWNDYSAGRYKVTAKALSMNGTTTEYILNNGTKYYENTGVKVSEQSIELTNGDTANLTATTYINGTTGWAVTWSSSNTSVATVDANGKVTAVGVGTAIITVTSGSSSANCTVITNQNEFNTSYTSLLKNDIKDILGEGKKSILHHYTPNQCIDIILSHDSYITEYCNTYRVPKEFVQTILLRELWCVNKSDDLADSIVNNYYIDKELFENGIIDNAPIEIKTDSSTGLGQMFAWVAIDAHNLAVDNKLISDIKYSKSNLSDVGYFWNKLRSDNQFAIKMVTLEMYHCALDSGLTYDFYNFSDTSIKSVLARYNGTGDEAVNYGNQCFEYYQVFKKYSDE